MCSSASALAGTAGTTTGAGTGSCSNGFGAAWRCRCDRCRYTVGVREVRVAQEDLDRAQVGAGLEEVRRVRVSQRVRD